MTPREKTCKGCGEKFQPVRPMQTACKPACAVTVAQRTRERKERAELREAKQKAKTRGDWLREAQAAFNSWARARDEDLPCISCGRWHNGQWHAGHYMSTGARPNLRFDEQNVHKQCSVCNNHLHGNLVNYRRSLIVKIGLEAVEALEADQSIKKYSIEDLKQIKQEYTRKRKALEDSK